MRRRRSPRRPLRPSEQARRDHRAAVAADRKARRDADRPADAERPPLFTRRHGLSIPVDWHRSTMAHLCSMYPFHADRGFGEAGVYIGTNVTAGLDGFYYDPFDFYGEHIFNPNMIVTGAVGSGKSAHIKAIIKRNRAVNPDRFIAVLDPKAEYVALAEWLGIPVIKLQPGGRHQLNPMEAAGDGDPADAVLVRQGLAAQMVAGALGRDLLGVEDAVLSWAVAELSHRRRVFTFRDLIGEMDAPDSELGKMARLSPVEMAKALSDVKFALQKLCQRSLRGMFDAPTNVAIDWRHGPGVVLDLSAVHSDQLVLPFVMAAATYFLGEAMRQSGRQKLQVIDEAWAAVRYAAPYIQSMLKLARGYGVANILAVHRPADLAAQNDDGTAASKIAQGLLPDIDTRVLLRQPSDQVSAMTELFELSERERAQLTALPVGRAIWKISRRSAVAQLMRSPLEKRLFYTDSAMRLDDEAVA